MNYYNNPYNSNMNNMNNMNNVNGGYNSLNPQMQGQGGYYQQPTQQQPYGAFANAGQYVPPDPLSFFPALPKFPEYKYFPPELLEALEYTVLHKSQEALVSKEEYMREDLVLGYPILYSQYRPTTELGFVIDMYNLRDPEFARLKGRKEFFSILSYPLKEEDIEETIEKTTFPFVEGTVPEILTQTEETIERINSIASGEQLDKYRLGVSYFMDRDYFLTRMFKDESVKWLTREEGEKKYRDEEGFLFFNRKHFYDIMDTLIHRFRFENFEETAKVELVVFDNREVARREMRKIEDPFKPNRDRIMNKQYYTRELLTLKIQPFKGYTSDYIAHEKGAFYDKVYPFDFKTEDDFRNYVQETERSNLLVSINHYSHKGRTKEKVYIKNSIDYKEPAYFISTASHERRKHFLPNNPELDKYIMGILYLFVDALKSYKYCYFKGRPNVVIGDFMEYRKKYLPGINLEEYIT